MLRTTWLSPLFLFTFIGCGSGGDTYVLGSGGNHSSTGGSSSGGASASGGQDGSGGATSSGAAASSGGSSGGANGSGGAGATLDSSCTGSELLLCDGFESGVIDEQTWSVRTDLADDVVEVTTSRAARGQHSVHISTKNGYGFLRNTSVFPVENNDYFGRMFLFVEQFSTVDWAHWTVAEAAGTGDGSLIRVGGQFATNLSENRWGIGSDGGPTGDWTNHDADPPGAVLEPAVGRWVCVEWEHKGSSNETRLFIDGEEHPSLATSASDHGGTDVDYVLPEFSSVWFGWYQYQSDSSLRFEVFIDELAIDQERIGCD